MPDAPPDNPPASDIIVVMGVSASGKSTVATGIATAMRWEFAEGDDFHRRTNVERTCSALRRDRPHVRFLHVPARGAVIADRVERRAPHDMSPSLVPSQLATLEPLAGDEPGVSVTTEGDRAQIRERCRLALGLRTG
jgi:gluconokinase